MQHTVAILVLCVTGCGLLVDVGPPTGSPDGSVPRRDGGPSGLDGETPPPDAIAAPDGATPTVRCGGPTTLMDDFETPARDALWGGAYQHTGVVVTESSGALTVRPPDVPVTDPSFDGRYGGYFSTFAVDLTEDWVSVEVVEALDLGTFDAQTYLSLHGSDGTSIGMYLSGGFLFAGYAPAGVDTAASMTPYESSAHRWWRVRESGGTLFWETSADGVVFGTELRREPAPDAVRALYVDLGAGISSPTPGAGAALFDNLNMDGLGRPRAPFCLAGSFSDAFEDGVRAPEWWVGQAEGALCTVWERPGDVQFISVAGAEAGCEFANAMGWDLRGQEVWIHLGPITDYTPNLQFSLWLYDRSYQPAILSFIDGGFVAYTRGAAVSFAYENPRYWKLREEGGDLVFTGSPDGVSWGPSVRLVPGVDMSAVTVGFGLQSSGPISREIAISVNGYNTD